MKQIKRIPYLIMILFTAIVLFSCTAGKQSAKTTLQADNNYPLTETYWKLTELLGQPVTTDANRKEMFLMLKTEGIRVQGNAGCNSFMGSYTLQEGNRLSFSQLAGTMMACPDIEKEQQFMKLLPTVDNYAIKGNILSLNRARMAPLARFEAVVLKK
jgi:heat shock protein HslJ